MADPQYDYTKTEEYFNQIQETERSALRQQMEMESNRLENSYKIAKLQAKTDAQRLKLDEWHYREQIKLMKRTADLEKEKFGLEKQRFQFEQDKFGTETGIDLLKFQSTLSGPANFVQSANFAQGVAGDPRYAGFMQNLVNGQNGRMFGPASGTPQAQTMGSLAGLLGGGGGDVGSTAADQLANGGNELAQRAAQAQSLVQGAQQLGQAGGGSLGGQALERQSPTNLALLQSGFGGAGQDFNEWIRQYQDSRVGQNTSAAAA